MQHYARGSNSQAPEVQELPSTAPPRCPTAAAVHCVGRDGNNDTPAAGNHRSNSDAHIQKLQRTVSSGWYHDRRAFLRGLDSSTTKVACIVLLCATLQG